jgi:hypothetical protein
VVSKLKWPLASAVAVTGGIIVPIVLFIIGRESRALTVATVAVTTLADLSDSTLAPLELTYKGRHVMRVTTASIEVRNSGTHPIHRNEFERPIVLKFGRMGKILAAVVGYEDPANLDPLLSFDSTSVTSAPLMLNSGDVPPEVGHLRIGGSGV